MISSPCRIAEAISTLSQSAKFASIVVLLFWPVSRVGLPDAMGPRRPRSSVLTVYILPRLVTFVKRFDKDVIVTIRNQLTLPY
jgi:hypothetical protein